MWTEEQINVLLSVADQNDGHCDRCQRVIRVYRYPLNKTMARMIRAMRQEYSVMPTINFDKLDLPYSVKTQRTKLRLHGLIAHAKDARGENVPNTWIITNKGWDFLNGQETPLRVVVFDNQVLGHIGGTTTIHRLMDETVFEQQNITTAEAAAYHDVRTPQRQLTYDAVRVTRDKQPAPTSKLQIKQLKLGQPVEITAIDDSPTKLVYKDIAAFQRAWRIV